jgi:hypothetical protein
LGQPFAAAITFDVTNQAATCFAFGAKSTLSTASQVVNQWDQLAVANSVYGSSNRSEYMNGVVHMVAAWNAVVADAAIFNLLRDPFAMLIFPDDDLMAETMGPRRARSHRFP